MKSKYLFLAMAAAALASCSSSDEIAGDNGTSTDEAQSPITFNTRNRNITRAGAPSGLETVSYNFGVYGFKENANTNVPIMGNYLVGFSGTDAEGKNVGYYTNNSKTYAKDAGTTTDHKSPWFYDVLGTSQYTYTGTDGFYTTTDADKMSANSTQALVYWDHAYNQTEFDCYAPYDNQAEFDYSTKKLTLNTNPEKVMYVKKVVNGGTSGNYDNDVTDLVFTHAGSEVRLAFYSDIDNYRVEIMGLKGDDNSNATFASTATDDDKSSIVATPATLTDGTYAKGSYANAGKVTIDYSGDAAVASFESATSQDNLHFKVPTDQKEFSVTKLGQTEASKFNVVPEKATTGDQTYSYTDTVQVVPAATPSANSGFTFHVTFKIISKATGEEVNVYNARVFVPATYTAWEQNNRYTYVFRITSDATGSTDPTTEIDPSGVEVPSTGALVPIVFDGVQVADLATGEVTKEFNINDANE